MSRPAIPTTEGASDPDSLVRVASYALDYVGTVVPSDFSWLALAGSEARPDLERSVICRPGTGSDIDPVRFVDEYHWFGFASDPFRIPTATDPGDVIRGPSYFGGEHQFSLHPFTCRFLARHGLATRTVLYLRDRGPVFATIALDRLAGSTAPDAHETMLLLKLAPFLSQALSAHAEASVRAPTGPGLESFPIAGLTSREEQVARMISRGLSNDEIAQELSLSKGTVKIHVSHLYRKAGVRSRARLLTLLLRQEAG